MSKHRYNSVQCKDVDWSELAERVAGRPVVLAIDVAKEDFVVAVQDGPEHTVVRVKWRHPEESPAWLTGVGQLVAPGRRVEAVLESSGTYGDALRWQLERRGIAVYRVSAKHVHDSAEVYDGVASLHDAKATELIGKLHWEGRSRRWAPLSAERRALLAQVRRLTQSKLRERAERNRLEALLARHWPEVLPLFKGDSVALLTLLADYGSPAQVVGLAGPAARHLHQRSRGQYAREQIAQLLERAAHTLGVPCVAEERALLCWQAQQVLAAQAQVQAAEQALVAVAGVARTPPPAVLGPVTGAVLLATQGDPADYPTARSYIKALGLNLTEQSSGHHHGPLHLSKRGPGLARFYLYYAALRLLAREPRIQRWYAARMARPGAVALKQVIALMRKLAAGLWHHARGEPFDTARLVAPGA